MRASLLLLSLFSASLMAQPEGLEPVPDAAPVTAPRTAEEMLEPEVTIIQRGSGTVEEYRVNGQLYMVKVTPAKGVPYYLMDSDGDGDLDARRSELDPHILVPHWVIFRW